MVKNLRQQDRQETRTIQINLKTNDGNINVRSRNFGKMLSLHCIYQIWTLEQVGDDNQILANMKDMDNAIIFRSRDFKKAISPCHQELRLPNFDINRFKDTDSLRLL